MKFYDGLIGHELGPDFNSLGHRCRELKDITLHNYFLFAGDNVSLGLGTPIEETYPYLISKQLRYDYYNISIFNGGLDAIRYNLITWFTKMPHKPKALIISSEFLNSLIVTDLNYSYWRYCDLSDEKVQDLLDAGNMTGFFNARHIFAEKQLLNLIKVPIYQIVFKDRQALFKQGVTSLYVDTITDHVTISDLVVNEMKKVSEKIRP